MSGKGQAGGKRLNGWGACAGMLLGMIFISGQAGAQVIAEQAGNADPVAPGQSFRWTNAGRSSFGKGVDEPEAAWKIVTDKGAPLCYWMEPSTEDVEKAFRQGWRLTVRMRADTELVPLPQRYANTFGFESEAKEAEWMAGVVIDESNGLILEVNRSQYPLPGLSGSEYHTYEMVYDPESNTVGVNVDGQTVAGNIKPAKADKTRIVWGNTSVQAASASEWALVKVEILQP